MKLTIAERVNLINGGLLPSKDTMENMALTKDIMEKLTFSTEEVEEIDLKTTEEGRVTWKQRASDEPYEIEFKPKELVLMDKRVTELSNSKEITPFLYDVCKKIQESV